MSDVAVDVRIKKAGLLDMSGDESMTPELIEDAIDGTIEVLDKIDINNLADEIKRDQSASNGESQ
jgi:hypothetical protein